MTRALWASQDSLVGLGYLTRCRSDTGIGMVKAKTLRPKFQIIHKLIKKSFAFLIANADRREFLLFNVQCFPYDDTTVDFRM